MQQFMTTDGKDECKKMFGAAKKEKKKGQVETLATPGVMDGLS